MLPMTQSTIIDLGLQEATDHPIPAPRKTVAAPRKTDETTVIETEKGWPEGLSMDFTKDDDCYFIWLYLSHMK